MTSRGVNAAPERTCVACRRRRPQDELLRLALAPEGWRADLRRRLPGRGAYVCLRASCFAVLAQGKAALRGFQAANPRRDLAQLASGPEFQALLDPSVDDVHRS